MQTQSDKSTRKQAIPFVANSFTSSGFDSDGFFAQWDSPTIVSTKRDGIIRCATPSGGNLIEAHLNLQMNVTNPLGVKVAIGYFDTTDTNANESYSDQYVNAQHEFLTGSSDPIESSGGILFIDGLNILPKIPLRGDSNFQEWGFVLILRFDRMRDTTGLDELKKFEVSCSTLMGLI
jgi:hypothetical protein